jgi:hypothetical protein
MTEATKVWASNTMLESRIMAPLRIMPNDRDRFDYEQDELQHWAAVHTDYKEALIKDSSVLPGVLTGSKLDTKLRKLPDFFNGGGFFIVSQRCRCVNDYFRTSHPDSHAKLVQTGATLVYR